MKPLTEVATFGGIDADTDSLLEACFSDHEAYHEVLNHGRWLVIGRKGSGKTAIYKKIIHKEGYDTFSFGHTFSDYPWAHHSAQGVVGVPEEARFQQSWTYLVLLTIAKILLNKDNSQPFSDRAADNLERIEKFLVDSYGSRDPHVTQIFSPAQRLRVAPHLKVAGDWLTAGVNIEQLPVRDLPVMIQEVNRNITVAITESLNPEFHYYVCFDELDRGFDPDSADYRSMLTGLLLAARNLNANLRIAGAKVTIAVFLRDDIYETLRFEDKNKITEDAAIRVEWDSLRTKWTLKSLMEKRFVEALEDKAVSWDQLFDETKEMPGHQTKYQHITDRTFLRPRDMIRFCNEVLSVWNHADTEESSSFVNDHVASARKPYSEYFLNELHDEVPKHVPDFDRLLDVIRSIGVAQFDRAAFDEATQKIRLEEKRKKSPETILEDLFRFSILAYQKTGGAGGGSEYVWRYLDARARFDHAAQSFRVHPGLIESLGLKRYAHKKTESA